MEFLTKYSSKDYLDKRSQVDLNHVNGIDKLCEPFEIICREIHGYWGLWLYMDEEPILIDPLGLVSSIYETSYNYLSAGDFKNIYVSCHSIQVYNNGFCYQWIVMNDYKAKSKILFFTFDEYISKIKTSIIQLYNEVNDGGKLCYDKLTVESETLEICVKQLEVTGAFPSHYKKISKDVILDKFEFLPINESCSEYQCGFLNRKFKSFITDWDNDYDEIRQQLENYYFHQEAELKLSFDTSITHFSLKGTDLLKEIKNVEKGYAFDYDRFCVIKILTDDLNKSCCLKGNCKEDSTIHEFYEGLLLMARNYIIDSSDSFYNYNKMKSPIIEKYLKTGCLFSEKPLKRQVEIRYILELNSDCDYIIKSILHPNKPFIVTENKLPIPDKGGNLICVSGLSQWIREVQDLKFEIKMFEEFEVDFNELQERGLRLAKEIKDQMPDYFDLWYYMPLLDKENKYQHPILIF